MATKLSQRFGSVGRLKSGFLPTIALYSSRPGRMSDGLIAGNSLDTMVFIFSLVTPSNPLDSPLIDDGEAVLSGGWFGSSSSGDAGRDLISRLLFRKDDTFS